MTMLAETRELMEALLRSDPEGLRSLNVSGADPASLSITVAAGPIPVGPGYSTDRREIVAGLVQRMQSLRWSAFDPYLLSIPLPTSGQVDALREKHAACRNFAQCGDGWLWLLDACFVYIAEIEPAAEWATTDVKEKYASLRLSYSGNLGDDGDEIINAAESLSMYICDVCGALGTLHKEGWMVTRCHVHARAHLL